MSPKSRPTQKTTTVRSPNGQRKKAKRRNSHRDSVAVASLANDGLPVDPEEEMDDDLFDAKDAEIKFRRSYIELETRTTVRFQAGTDPSIQEQYRKVKANQYPKEQFLRDIQIMLTNPTKKPAWITTPANDYDSDLEVVETATKNKEQPDETIDADVAWTQELSESVGLAGSVKQEPLVANVEAMGDNGDPGPASTMTGDNASDTDNGGPTSTSTTTDGAQALSEPTQDTVDPLAGESSVEHQANMPATLQEAWVRIAELEAQLAAAKNHARNSVTLAVSQNQDSISASSQFLSTVANEAFHNPSPTGVVAPSKTAVLNNETRVLNSAATGQQRHDSQQQQNIQQIPRMGNNGNVAGSSAAISTELATWNGRQAQLPALEQRQQQRTTQRKETNETRKTTKPKATKTTSGTTAKRKRLRRMTKQRPVRISAQEKQQLYVNVKENMNKSRSPVQGIWRAMEKQNGISKNSGPNTFKRADAIAQRHMKKHPEDEGKDASELPLSIFENQNVVASWEKARVAKKAFDAMTDDEKRTYDEMSKNLLEQKGILLSPSTLQNYKKKGWIDPPTGPGRCGRRKGSFH